MVYYLLRCHPLYMLNLQSGKYHHHRSLTNFMSTLLSWFAGKFDTPDRLFFSIYHTYRGVTTNTADVKELIPEFYMPYATNRDFLVNQRNLDLGVTSTGHRVNDVLLPPWAPDSATFIQRCRDALESPMVSQTLHNWLDLIFGYKQVISPFNFSFFSTTTCCPLLIGCCKLRIF